MCGAGWRKMFRIITGPWLNVMLPKRVSRLRFVEILFSLRWYVEFVMKSPCSKSSMEYSEEEPALQCRRQSARRTHRHWSLVHGLLRGSWIRGYPDSRITSFGRTVGLWRYKIEDFVPCLDGTLLGVEGKLGKYGYVDLLPCNRLCVTLAPSGVYINWRV